VGYLPATGELPLAARRAFLVPGLVHSLISVPTLCDHGCIATFTALTVDVSFNGRTVYTGSRVGSTTNALDRLWRIDFDCPPVPIVPIVPIAGVAQQLVQHDTQAELVAFYHAAMGSPALPTFIEAVTRKFLVLPGLTAALIRKNPPSLFATAKGHLNRSRSNLRSTKLPVSPPLTRARTACRDWAVIFSDEYTFPHHCGNAHSDSHWALGHRRAFSLHLGARITVYLAVC
jgi:hypothetical protein